MSIWRMRRQHDDHDCHDVDQSPNLEQQNLVFFHYFCFRWSHCLLSCQIYCWEIRKSCDKGIYRLDPLPCPSRPWLSFSILFTFWLLLLRTMSVCLLVTTGFVQDCTILQISEFSYLRFFFSFSLCFITRYPNKFKIVKNLYSAQFEYLLKKFVK